MNKYPCVYMRGGTSKALFFRREVLPKDRDKWPDIFLRAMGSPDIKQIDGLGGATSSTSKVAVISPSSVEGADVDYDFFQVDILIPHVDNTANCGNISAAVGPYAIDEGMVPAIEPETVVRIYNTNTGKIIEERVQVQEGHVRFDGSTSIEGVPGTGAPIEVFFLEPAGSKSGSLFPTGKRRELFQIPGFKDTEVTLIDCANPVLFLHASALEIQGTELTELNQNKMVMEHIEALRGVAAQKLGFVSDWKDAQYKSTSIPKVGIISPPQDYKDLDGHQQQAGDMDLCIRAVSVGMLHKAIPLTVAAATSAAALLKGTVVYDTVKKNIPAKELYLGHASGITPVSAIIDGENHVVKAGMIRTARRIMDGFVYV